MISHITKVIVGSIILLTSTFPIVKESWAYTVLAHAVKLSCRSVVEEIVSILCTRWRIQALKLKDMFSWLVFGWLLT